MSVFEKDEEFLEKEGSFQRKFGLKIAKAGVIVIPYVLLYARKLGLKYSDFYFICYILSKKYDRNWPHFSMNKITRELGICQDTLHAIKNRLIKKGFLRIENRKDNPRGKGRNIYNLSGLFIILEMLIDKNKDKLLKTKYWTQKDYIDYAFLKDIEKDKFSEEQRGNEV